MNHLFLSFSYLLHILADGPFVSYVELPSQEILDKGLFAFQCTRERVFLDEESKKEITLGAKNCFAQQKRRWDVLCEHIRPAVLRAEQDDRAIWRKEGEDALSFVQLNVFLRRKRLGPFLRQEIIDEWSSLKSYNPKIARLAYESEYLKVWDRK